MSYTPPDDILEKYAKILVNFALGGGTGIKPGEVVYLGAPLSALPFYRALRKTIIDSGGLIISSLSDDMSGAGRYFFEHASDQQLSAFLEKYYRGLVDEVDHRIGVIADYDVHELKDIDPKKIMVAQKAAKPLMDWFNQKENAGKHTWTLALYGTPAMAKEANLGLKEYWDQIIKGCYLDFKDPVTKWKYTSREIQRIAKKLTDLKIERVHVKGEDVDLKINVGKMRRWLGGGGRNIPSFEVFTSPDWRGAEGRIKFNQPLYRYGSVVEGIEIIFKNGRVARATATKNENLLKEMLATDTGASQIGEFSLTDKRLSRISKFMAETLFDENIGGTYGNTHIAVGKSYHDAYAKSTKNVQDSVFKSLGFNDSAIHTDMISTSDRTVTAYTANGNRQIIYQDGKFTV